MTRRSYSCTECGLFSVEQSIKDETLTKCPKCGSEVKRNLKADSDGLYYDMSPFMEELIRPEWKAKGKRWRTTRKIVGIDK